MQEAPEARVSSSVCQMMGTASEQVQRPSQKGAQRTPLQHGAPPRGPPWSILGAGHACPSCPLAKEATPRHRPGSHAARVPQGLLATHHPGCWPQQHLMICCASYPSVHLSAHPPPTHLPVQVSVGEHGTTKGWPASESGSLAPGTGLSVATLAPPEPPSLRRALGLVIGDRGQPLPPTEHSRRDAGRQTVVLRHSQRDSWGLHGPSPSLVDAGVDRVSARISGRSRVRLIT